MKKILPNLSCFGKTFTKKRRGFHALALFGTGVMLSVAATGHAQTSGTISGHVSDPTNASVPETNIVLRNVGTGTERKTITTSAGDYTFTEVPVGIYVLSATHNGFKTSSSQNVEVQVQQAVRLDFTLQIGDITESVEVEATGALLQAENGTIGTVIENKTVTELPLNGRNYLGLVALSSNVNTLSPASGQAGSRLGGDRAAQSIAVGGQRIMFDYYTLDGVVNTDPDFNTYIALPSLDGIQEFKVQTGVYSAEYGHEASQVNVVSKSGTNTFHGSAYEFIRNNYVDATPYRLPFNAPSVVNPFKWNDFGFELDGPVRIPKIYNGKDKFFFMIDDEWRRIRQSGQSSAFVPTVAQQNGDFSSYTDKTGKPIIIYDPTTGDVNGLGKQQFSCNGVKNVICANRIDPVSKRLLAYYGSSNTPTNGNAANYAYGTSSPQNRQSFTARGDYYQSEKSQFAFRYSAGNEDIIGTGLAGAGSKTVTNYYSYMGSNVFTFTPHLVNEARFGYSHFFNSLGLLSAYTADVVGGLQIPGLASGPSSTWGIPNVAFATGPGTTTANFWSNFGDSNDGPYVVDDPMWQIVDNVSWVKGKHSLKFGFEYNRQHFNQLGNQFSRGVFGFQPWTTALVTGTPGSTTMSQGDAFADYLLGTVHDSTVAVAVANASFVRNVESGYVEDTYKATQKLTISAGLRYELTPPWVDTVGNDFTVYMPTTPQFGSTTYPQTQWPYFMRQGTCNNPYAGLSINWTDTTGKAGTSANPAPVCSNGVLPDALMKTVHTNFAPRLSFAYSPTPTTVVRAGFGLFYNQDVGNAYFDLARNIAGRVALTSGTSKPQGTTDLTWSNSVPGGGGSGAVAQIPPPYAYTSAINHKTTYTEQFLINLQQQVGKNWSFEAGYLGALSRHLYGFLNMNQPTPYGYIGSGAKTTVASRLPFSNYSVIQLVNDGGSGNYHALALKANRRFSNGFNVIASYTYSKSLDNTSGIRNQGNDQLFPQNSYCLSCEYGPSAFDVRHRIVGSLLYELPFGPDKLVKVKGFVNAVVGGWQVGTIITHQTGAPGTVTVGFDNSSIGSANGTFDRPNYTGVSPYLSGSNRSLNTWVNKAAYVNPTPGFFGNVSRGSYYSPGITNMDASLHKQFTMPYSEHHHLDIRFEAFNALNHPNWGAPNLNLSSATFGRISGVGTMRQLQLAAKYVF